MKSDRKIKLGVLSTVSKTMDWFLVPSMRNLAKHGYDITLIANMEEGFAERNSDFAKCIHFEIGRGVNIKDFLFAPRRLKKIFREEGFDAIYYMTPNAAMYASIAGKRAKIKTRIYNQCGIRYVAFSGLKRRIFRFVERLTCKNSTHVKSQSPKNMQFAIDEGLTEKDKISVVGIGGTIGVDLSECRSFDKGRARTSLREKYGIPSDAFVYGYVGRINADKGINELIEAFFSLKDEKKDAYLVLVGMYDEQNPISKENYELASRDERVVLTGNVPTDEVYAHMAMLDCLTHPTYREGFGKVLQEAMGVGIPIITTDIPGPSEVVENGKLGILCRARDSAELADKMRLLYENAELRSALSREGLARAEKYFDRPIMLKNILDDMNETVIMG